MVDNNNRSTIDIFQEITGVIRQLILLDTLEQLLQTAKDDDTLKFLPLIKSIANCASTQIVTSEQPKNDHSIFSLIALLEQRQTELSSQSDHHDK